MDLLMEIMETTTSTYSNWSNIEYESTTDFMTSSTTTTTTSSINSSVLIQSGEKHVDIIYCGPGWTSFWASISFLVIPLRATLSVLGIITNILNILVFTRRPMRNPTNTILTALCVTDLLCLLRLSEYLIVTNLTKLGEPEWVKTYPMAFHQLASDILVQLFHSWSVNLTLAIAFWRLVGVAQPLRSRSWCTQKGARWVISTALVIGVLLMIPMYWHARIGLTGFVEENGVKVPQYVMAMDPYWDWHLYLLINIIFIKVVPCSILTIVTTTLVVYLLRAKRNRSKLVKSGTTRQPANSNNIDNSNANSNSNKKNSDDTTELPQSAKQKLEYDRTTRMLLMVLIFFLITEFPFAIINILNNILPQGYAFVVQCKNPPLRFLSSAEYMSGCFNFFVYLIMSKNFRAHCFQLLKIKSSSQVTSRSGQDTKSTSTTVDSHV